MGKSKAIRLLVIHSLACALFSGGYCIGWYLEEQNLWREELSITVPAAHGQQPREPASTPAYSGVLYDDVANEAGIDFSYYDGAMGNFQIVETAGGGVGVLDFDSDGHMDLFFPNGVQLLENLWDETHRSRLYANRGDLGFDDVSRQAGVDLAYYAQGAAAADYDNDGFDDLFVTGFRRTALYHNLGDGTFQDVATEAGVWSDCWSTSAALADLDGDGQLDLYVCTYADVSLIHILLCREKNVRIHCPPEKYPPQPDLLFRNLGDGTFHEVARSSGIIDDTGRGLAVAIADLNGDGRPDIFVANDTSENFLFINQGDFRFEESALTLGAALNGAGHYMAGMGVACADYDHDGTLDLFVTDFYGVPNALFRNLGTTGFIEQSVRVGLAAPSHDRLGFGTNFLDADLDGHPDLFVANGHVSDLTALNTPYKMRQQFFRNHGNGTFSDESDSAGIYFRRRLLGRGSATADINNDGRTDVIVSHIGDPAALLINRTAPHGHWLGLKLLGRQSNRAAINAKVRVTFDDHSQFYEVAGGSSYLSTSDRRLLVGLGPHRSIEALEVEWPSGRRQQWRRLPIDRYHSVVEPSNGD